MNLNRMSNSMLGAMAQSSEPTVQRDNDSKKVDFRPMASLIFPARGMVIVEVNWKAFRTHPARISDASKDDVITGKATATAVPLIEKSKSTRPTTAKIRYLDMLQDYTLLQCVEQKRLRQCIQLATQVLRATSGHGLSTRP